MANAAFAVITTTRETMNGAWETTKLVSWPFFRHILIIITLSLMFPFAASEMSQFHRSYALKVQGQDEECTEQNLEQFYQQNGKRIRNYQDRSSSSDDEDDQDNDDDDDYQQRQKFDGTYFEDSNEEMDNNYNRADSFFGGNNEQQRNKDNNDDQLDMFGNNNNNKNRRNQKTQCKGEGDY
jgi:hypothetical protein